jgi:predicted AAA+ superfamily ATPase
MDRILDLPALLEKKSFFLFGPRAVGKSYAIRQQLTGKAFLIDLLNTDYYLRLVQNPALLSPMIESALTSSDDIEFIVIDEVQKIPALLDEVHRLIEERQWKFLLTGSSARKLKKVKANLLAGRAREARMFPLVSAEIETFDLERYLQYGGLPAVYLSEEPQEELQAYVQTYLREEIQAEAVVRSLPSFSRFLEASALTSGEILNFTQIASDTGISASTVREYYFVLEDTFIGFMVQPFRKTTTRKAISTAKFYYFDLGVSHYLARIHSLPRPSELYGQAFEHFIAMELRAYLSYRRKLSVELYFWQEKNGKEVDFIVGDELAIEVKSTEKVSEKHLSGLRYLMEEKVTSRHILVSHDPIPLTLNGIETMHWKAFLKSLWADRLITVSEKI